MPHNKGLPVCREYVAWIVATTRVQNLKIGVTMNKLDTFNEDKIKCKKCKEYYDYDSRSIPYYKLLCDSCYEKWFNKLRTLTTQRDFENWCNKRITNWTLSTKIKLNVKNVKSIMIKLAWNQKFLSTTVLRL